MPETTLLATTWGWIVAKLAFVAKIPLTIPLAIGGVFLMFMTVPTSRKLTYLGAALASAIPLAYLVDEFGKQWEWGNATTLAVAYMCGFFALAFALYLGKMHTAILADDTLVSATLDRLRNWIGGKK